MGKKIKIKLSEGISLDGTNPIENPAQVKWTFNDEIFDNRLLFANRHTGTIRSPLDANLFTQQTTYGKDRPYIEVDRSKGNILSIHGKGTKFFKKPEICFFAVAFINSPLANLRHFRPILGETIGNTTIAPDGTLYIKPEPPDYTRLVMPSIDSLFQVLISALPNSDRAVINEIKRLIQVKSVLEYSFVFSLQPKAKAIKRIAKNVRNELGLPKDLKPLSHKELKQISRQLSICFRIDPLAKITSTSVPN